MGSELATVSRAAPVPGTAKRFERAEIAMFPGAKPGDPPQTAICKLHHGRIIRTVLQHVTLDPASGHTYPLPMKVGDQWTSVLHISAAGYYVLNRVACVSFIQPRQITDDEGKPQNNPWIVRSERGGIRFVRVMRIGIGHAPTGALVAVPYVTHYDLETYLAQDLWSKWTGKKSAELPKAWGFAVPRGKKPPADIAEKFRSPMAVPMPTGVDLWVDLMAMDVIAVMGEHTNRQKFALANAQTMCDRNILKKLLAVNRLGKGLSVPVVGWVEPDADMERLAEAMATSVDGKVSVEGGSFEVAAPEVVTVDSPESEEVAALSGEADEDMPRDDGDEAVESSVAASSSRASEPDPCLDLRGEVRIVLEAIGADVATDAIMSAFERDAGCKLGECRDADKVSALLEALRARQLAVVNERAKARGPKPATSGKQGELVPGATKAAVRT